MIDLAKLRVVIDGENRGALRALDETDRKVASTSRGISGAMGFAAKAVIASTTAAVGGIAGFGVKVAASNEQAAVSFTTMLGSAEKAQAFLQDLNKFAAATPFEMPELRAAASSLISIGVETSKVIPIMTTLGNVTSGMGTGAEGVKRATIALQQMNAAGRITGEDLNQLRDAGIPVFDLLAAATGKAKEEVSALAQSGKLGKKELEQLMAALESGKGMERFAGLMDKQSQTLTGMLSTLKDTVSQMMGKAMEPAVAEIKKQLPGITDAIGGALQKLAPVIGPVIGSVGQAFQALLPAITPILDVMSQLLASGLGALATTVSTVVAPALKDLQPLFDGLTKAFGILADAFGPAIKPLVDGFVAALNALAPALPGIAAMIGKLAAVVGAGLGRVLMKMAPQIPAITESLVRLAEEALPPLLDTVIALTPVLEVLVDLFAKGLVTAINAVMPVIVLAAEGLRGLAKILEAVFLGKWSDIFDGAAKKVNEWIDAVLGFFGDLPGKLADIASDIWKPIANGFIDMLNFLISAWNELDFKLPSFGGMHIGDKTVIPGWEGPTLGVPDIPEIPKFHAGGVSKSEGLALLRRDETVFTPDQMRVLGQAIAAGGSAQGTISITSAPTLRVEGSVYADDLESRLQSVLKKHDRDLLDELTARGLVARR